MARPKKEKPGNNLYGLDYESIERKLHELNEPLLRRCQDLIAALERAPKRLETGEQAEKAALYSRQLARAAADLRAARIADGKPFRAANQLVKEFFEKVELPLRKAADAIQSRLTEVALRMRPAAPPNMGEPPPPAIGTDVAGQPVVIAPRPTNPAQIIPPAIAGIRLDWEISGFHRAAIDLEALRPFLTEASILAACRKHLDENGPNTLGGVLYRQVAAR